MLVYLRIYFALGPSLTGLKHHPRVNGTRILGLAILDGSRSKRRTGPGSKGTLLVQ